LNEAAARVKAGGSGQATIFVKGGWMRCARMVVLAGALWGQAAWGAEAARLAAGDAAPPLKVERFIKGEAVGSLAKGTVYVIEFWATSCGPCVQTIPELSRVQAQYQDQGVVVVGVDVWEDGKLDGETLRRVEAYVAARGKRMNYRVAYDGAARQMDSAWLKAAGAPGIPWAVVVDRAGRIAWMGHSLKVGLVLEEVVSGRWDVREGPARMKAAESAFAAALTCYGGGLAAGDAAWANVAAAHPAMARLKRVERLAAVLQADAAAGVRLGREIVAAGKAAEDPAEMQSMLVVLRARREGAGVRGLLAEAADAVFALSDAGESATHLLRAENYFAVGEVEEGRAAGARAIALSGAEVREATVRYVAKMEATYGQGAGK
jgi:thiol-disulfide isomerase/thioredoxin